MNPIPNYKDIVDLIKKGATLEAQEKIMELREATLALQEENLKLRARIKKVEEKLEFHSKVKWEKRHLYEGSCNRSNWIYRQSPLQKACQRA